MDNFGIKYVGQEHAEHLGFVLNQHDKCKLEWEGQWYLGMDIDWDNTCHTVLVSVLEYVPEALTQFQQILCIYLISNVLYSIYVIMY